MKNISTQQPLTMYSLPSMMIRKKYLEKEFTLKEIIRYNLIPWIKNDRTVKKTILRDAEGENLLQVRKESEGFSARYYTKGKNINSFVKRYGGLFMADRPK